MPRVKQFDRDEILEKAMHLFWQKGFHGTSIGDLVAYTGINRQSLYSTFTNKDELFNQAFKRYQSINLEKFNSFLESRNSVKQGIKDFFLLAAENAINDPERKGCFIINTTTELVPDDKRMMSVIAENQRTFDGIMSDFLKKGINKGEFPSTINTESLASYFTVLYSGLKVVSKFNTDREYLIQIIDTALKVLDQPS